MSIDTITQREASAKFVESAVDHQGDLVASAVTEFLRTFLREGEEMPPILLLFQLFQRALAECRGKLVEADGAHRKELAGDAEIRRLRDEITDRLRSKIIRLRLVLEGLFGPDRAFQLVGLESRTPEAPLAVLALVKRIFERLLNPDPELLQVGFGGVRFDPQAVIATLKPDMEALEQSLHDVSADTRKSQVTAVARNEAIRDHDRVFSWAASALAACFRMAGQYHLAERIRPSVRRPGRTRVVLTEGEVDETAPEEDAPSSDA